MTRRRSLRAQLATVALLVVVAPLAVLVSVVVATDVTDNVLDPAGTGGPERVVIETTGTSPWVPVTALLLLAPAAAAVWWWSGRAVRPLFEIRAVADEIQDGSLERRIALEGAPTEVHQLAESFDRMLDRLAEASANQRRLIEDTSHDLRTPLAAISAHAEVLLTDPNADLDDYRAGVERVAALAGRLQSDVTELVADARRRDEMTAQADNDLVEVARRAVEVQRAATPQVPIEISAPDRVRVGIDGSAVERAVVNLLENAARHAPEGSTVRLAIDQRGDSITLSVTDQGPGIGAEEHARIFDRYEHGSDRDDRTGIGLAIVRTVADAYGGVDVVSPVDGSGGTTFTMRFPRVTPATSDGDRPADTG